MDIFSVLLDLFIIAIFVAAWKNAFLPGNRLLRNSKEKVMCCSLVAACAGGVWIVLLKWAASDVREDPGEVTFYLVASLLGIFVAQEAFETLGVSVRDDGIERRNHGALFAGAGFTSGAACCIAASHVGNGPGGEVVLFCALLSVGTLFVLWAALASAAGLSDTITIERDTGAGLRAGAFLAGSGAIFGASVAGDWLSFVSTLRDFARFAWPVIAVAALAIPLERTHSHRSLSKRLDLSASGTAAAITMIAAAAYALWVVRQ